MWKQERDEHRGRSRKRDVQKHANQYNAIKPSPPPKSRFLGNRGPRRFCTWCAPTGLTRRKADLEDHKEICRSGTDDIIVCEGKH